MTQLVYNHFRYSYSKCFDKCNYLHVSKICDSDVNFCNMRHPKYCKFYRENKICKFGEWCAYRHRSNYDETFHDTNDISSEVKNLKRVIKKKSSNSYS